MEKNKLFEARKSKGLSQSLLADKMCMDVSSYNRREKGQIKIHITEWERLAKILEVSLSEIYEPEENQLFICNDNTSVNYQGTNHIYSVPESLLDTQQKYIRNLEGKIMELQSLLGKK